MSFLVKIREKARTVGKRVVLPEGTDERVITAAAKIVELGVAKPIVLGHKEDMERVANDLGISLKGVEIIEGEVCPDHIHLLVSIPPKMSVSGFMGYLKGKSSLLIFQRFGNMKFAYRNREFWCKGYYVDTTGKNTAAIKSYIANQLKVDKEMEQLSIFDPRDPFTGSK